MKTNLILLILLTSMTLVKAQQQIADIIKPYRFVTKKMAINDSIELAYIDEGDGDVTLLFVHGLATYLPSWDKNIEVLREKYRCIAIDLPGYGRSSKANYPGTMSFYAQSIKQFADKLELKDVVLVGHSMGAQVSMVTALNFPHLVDQLVLVSPAGFETFNEKERVWLLSVFTPEIIAAATPEQIRSNYGLNFYKQPEDVEFMIQDRVNMTKADDFMTYCKVVSSGVAGMLSEPVFNKLEQIEQPVLVVYGTNDALIPNQILHKGMSTKAIAESGSQKLPNSTLKFVDECGHFVPFEKPNILNAYIDDFLSEH